MRQHAIEQRYAEALASLIEQPADLEVAVETLRTFAAQAVPDLEARMYWMSQRADHEAQKELVGKMLDVAAAAPLLRSFFEVLRSNHRVGHLPEIAEALDHVTAKRLGRTTAHVASARPLSEEQQEAIRNRLNRVSGKDVSLTTEVDEGLIGGVRVRLENTVIDDSVRGRLDALVAQFD